VVIEVVAVQMLRWLLNLGLISLIFLISFTAILFRLSLARRAPVEWSFITPMHILSHWSTLLSCTLVVSTLHHFSPHRKVGILWSKPIGFPHVVKWAPWPALGPGLQEHFPILHSFPHSHYSGNSTNNCMEDPCNMDSVHNLADYSLLHIYCLALEIYQGL